MADTMPGEDANAEQIAAWNGPAGEKWAASQERLDRILAPFAAAVLAAAAVKPGEDVLDIGCGCGATTLEAARLVGREGRAVGIDISRPMTTRAKERAAAQNLTAEFKIADAAVHAFEPHAYDVLISRFGVMFFDDPAAAFANMRRGLKSGGRLAFICWRPLGENPWLTVPLAAALAHVPAPEPVAPGAPGPFAFADPARVTSILETAGFHDIRVTPFDAVLLLSTVEGGIEEALAHAMDIGPISHVIADLPKDVRARVKESVREALLKHRTADGIALGGATWIVTARA